MFRFTIRDVLWLTLVVAMGARWWIERSERITIQRKYARLTLHAPMTSDLISIYVEPAQEASPDEN